MKAWDVKKGPVFLYFISLHLPPHLWLPLSGSLCIVAYSALRWWILLFVWGPKWQELCLLCGWKADLERAQKSWRGVWRQGGGRIGVGGVSRVFGRGVGVDTQQSSKGGCEAGVGRTRLNILISFMPEHNWTTSTAPVDRPKLAVKAEELGQHAFFLFFYWLPHADVLSSLSFTLSLFF